MSTAITTQRAKPFAWSFSALKNFEVCPRRHRDIDKLKRWKDEDSENLVWGKMVHDAFAKRLGSQTPMPTNMARYEPYAARFEAAANAMNADVKVELKLAITRDFQPCGYFDKRVDPWFRCVVDVGLFTPSVAMVGDWKTGKIKPDSEQLALTAATIFAHFPAVQYVSTLFLWLAENAETREDFTPTVMPAFWNRIWPRIAALEKAHNENNYPEKPSGLCKRHCPVKDCPYWGKGSY